ncbi:hypothetical protein [Deinococcus soli (ex Cha et al. 2016)]|uniref:Uncharacterized protein n=2 Tax=Deinococcus soli (ex Cha et al. 2016) TaxID=1309411 RepID=A0AAE3XL12_9DEIO|nr:hypothetical protein [Deinococcus soli (ex Cha et al. 2016)]MDR6221533.1 hypothetical protein [Deinococcus soli (ex Cha et al. 2016)]MDR6331514.1 hypothetical protein [Deinococcus soli (ex Cha et al. 2016)]MDR6754681.1 hypothetical protein [Deinococcus soli (ex Cha et al. 2016)]
MSAPKKKSLSIGAAMKQRMGQETQAQSAPVALPSKTPAPGTAPDVLESFNTRLPAGLHRRLKIHAAAEGRKIQDVVQAALIAYLDGKE